MWVFSECCGSLPSFRLSLPNVPTQRLERKKFAHRRLEFLDLSLVFVLFDSRPIGASVIFLNLLEVGGKFPIAAGCPIFATVSSSLRWVLYHGTRGETSAPSCCLREPQTPQAVQPSDQT